MHDNEQQLYKARAEAPLRQNRDPGGHLRSISLSIKTYRRVGKGLLPILLISKEALATGANSPVFPFSAKSSHNQTCSVTQNSEANAPGKNGNHGLAVLHMKNI